MRAGPAPAPTPTRDPCGGAEPSSVESLFAGAFGLLLGFVPLMLGTLGTGITLALHETAEETP